MELFRNAMFTSYLDSFAKLTFSYLDTYFIYILSNGICKVTSLVCQLWSFSSSN